MSGLAQWWRQVAEAEIDAVVAKAIEYGATDLVDLGRELARINHWELDDARAAEAGVYFYLRGKVARWTAALAEGRQVSDDTLHDIGVYVRMAQRIRQAGGWPGTEAPVPGQEGTPGTREPAAGARGPIQGPRAPERPPVAYVAHPLDNGTLGPLVYDVKRALRGLGVTWYDPGAAWTLAAGEDHSAVHAANLAVLAICDLMVVVADPGTFSAGTMIEATDRGRYAPGTVVVYGPELAGSVSMGAEGWAITRTVGELATAVASITH